MKQSWIVIWANVSKVKWQEKKSRIKNFPAADYVATGAGASGAGAAAASGAPPPAVFSNCKQKIGSSISKKVESNLLHTYNYVEQMSFTFELKVIFLWHENECHFQYKYCIRTFREL